MEKLIGIILYDEILKWQEEAIERIERCGYKVTIFSIKNNNKQLNIWLKFLFFLESKILGSNSKYLRHSKTDNKLLREKHSLNQLIDIFSLQFNLKDLNYVVSFIPLSDNAAADLSVSIEVPILQLNNPENKNNLSLAECVLSAYKKGEAVLDINLYLFSKGIKTIQYTTCNSIENGMLLKTVNAVLAKCALLIPRFLDGKSNSDNLVLERDFTIYLPLKHKRNLMRTFLYHLFDKGYYKRQWILLFDFQQASDFSSINSFKQLLPPKSTFWADPFVIQFQNNNYIFLEELNSQTNKGFISYCKINEGSVSKPIKIIEETFHMSFPNVFEYNNQFYMIPETSEANIIQLWLCESFPEKWHLNTKLIENIKALDVVIKKIKNRWWLFCSVKPSDSVSSHEELCIFYADDPISNKWIPHTKNPVISDARIGRNAGQIEEINGRYYRYGQFSGITYGKAISKSEIINISENEYQERFIELIFPDSKKGYHNLHTFNSNGEVSVGDSLRRIKRFF